MDRARCRLLVPLDFISNPPAIGPHFVRGRTVTFIVRGLRIIPLFLELCVCNFADEF